MGFVVWRLVPIRYAGKLDMIVNQDAIVEGRDVSRTFYRAVFVESGSGKHDVKRLPFAGTATSINRWRLLFVNRAALTIKICLVVKRIENLNFVLAHQVDAAIATPLPFAFDFRGRRKFDVQLTVTKILFRANVGAFYGGNSIRNFPLITVVKCVEIRAVKQDDRVRRSS